MKHFDIEALLAKNPQVNRDILRDNAQKVSDARKVAGDSAEKPVVSPYGGRRMVSDQEGKERARFVMDGKFRI